MTDPKYTNSFVCASKDKVKDGKANIDGAFLAK